MRSLTVSLLLFLLLVTFFACEKSDESNTQEQTRLDIYLTDGPGDYQQVNVDILQIRIKTADDTSQWLDGGHSSYEYTRRTNWVKKILPHNANFGIFAITTV